MNERIRELAEQARDWGYAEHSGYTAQLLFEQKFAELIVRECMDMCTELQADYLKHRKATDNFSEKHIYAEGESACDILQHKMKFKFGVEL